MMIRAEDFLYEGIGKSIRYNIHNTKAVIFRRMTRCMRTITAVDKKMFRQLMILGKAIKSFQVDGECGFNSEG